VALWWRHLQQHRQMREEMERPIKLNYQAPAPPPQMSFRNRVARQRQHWDREDTLIAARHGAAADIGLG
jgi:hypothetical protein